VVASTVTLIATPKRKLPEVKVQRRPQLGILETSLLSVNVMETDFPAGISVPPLARANTLRSLMRLD
jgi:hypothetical protein